MKINFDDVLGEGSFAMVYGTDDKNYVAKVEEQGLSSLLKKEAKLMMKMSEYDKEGKLVIPVELYKEDSENNIMIMKKMGISLSTMVGRTDVNMDEYSVKNIMRRLIQSMKYIHSFGYCHGDIKPENVMLTRDYKRVYLIDFGLAKAFMMGKKHIEYKEKVSPSGTLRFMSVNVNEWKKMSRRDDLISLGYMIIYLQTKYLPWQNINAPTRKQKYEVVARIKRQTTPAKMVEGCLPALKGNMQKYMYYVLQLEFAEMPDYDYLMSLFN